MPWCPPVLEVFVRDLLGKARSSREKQKQLSVFFLRLTSARHPKEAYWHLH